MKQQSISGILTGALIGFVSAGAPSAALAQGARSEAPRTEPPRTEAQGIDEVVVTARKREEGLLETPLSITAITAQDIERQGVSDLRDIVALTPGLSMSEFGAGTLNVPVIRGFSQLTGGAFAENNVSVFYNGVYIQNSNMVDATFLDIERIEIVKGPVSSLYGRNAYAGVINYVTKRASDELDGSARLIVGEYGRQAASGTISGPLGGSFRARLGARYDASDGSWRDPSSGVRFDGGERQAVQASLEFLPSDRFSAIASIFYADDDLDQPARQSTLGNCGGAAGTFQPALCGEIPDYSGSTVIRSSNPPYDLFGNRRELLLNTLTLSGTIGAVEIKSLSSYADTTYATTRDQDATGVGVPFTLVGAPAGTVNLSTYTRFTADNRSFSQELRASFDVGERVRLTLGGFYNDWSGNTTTNLTVDGRNIPAGRTPLILFPIASTPDGSASPFTQLVELEDEEYSGFVVVDIDATDQLTFSLEARRSHQRKLQNQSGGILRTPAVDPDGPSGIGGSWNFWSYRASGQYQLTPAMMLYASAARGSKAGGFNSGVGIPAADIQYDPEENDTYEIGLRSQFFDGRATAELTGFYSVLTGIHLLNFNASGVGSVINNGGDATAEGFEASLAARVAPGITLTAGVAYTNPTFDSGSSTNSTASIGQCRVIAACASRVRTDSGGRTVLELGGLQLPRQSQWQYTTTADIVRPLTAGLDWTLRGVYKYQSKQYATTPPTNVGWVGDANKLNLRAGVAKADSWSLEAYVDNALDDGTALNFGSDLNAANVTFPLAIVYGAKRSYGLEFNYNF
jgi:iron complex outermembrane recepter protein